jgi:hypothetical protein
MTLSYIDTMDRVISGIGGLIETIVTLIITFANSLLLIFMAMFIIGIVWAIFEMLKLSNHVERGRRN